MGITISASRSKLIALVALGAVVQVAAAARHELGKIVIDKFERLVGTPQKGPGATLIAHYELAKDRMKQDCFKPENLRWLQHLDCSDDVGLVTPIGRNRPFIDPRKGQPFPGHPNGQGDDLPFYDGSFESLAKAQAGENMIVNGSGAFLRDDPRAQVGQTKIRFKFLTCVVGIFPNNELAVLGGFSWGFDVKNTGEHTLLPLEGLRSDQVALGTFKNLVDGLNADFNTWRLGRQATLCPTNQFYLSVTPPVPEPGTLGVLSIGAVLVFRRRRRN